MTDSFEDDTEMWQHQLPLSWTELIYRSVGLNPYRALLLHLLLIGYPFCYGMLPTGWGSIWLDTEQMGPCSMFAQPDCSTSEIFAIRDMSIRFLLFYELAFFIWLVMFKNRTVAAIAYHKILLGTSLMSLLLWSRQMQDGILAGRSDGPLEDGFVWSVVRCYGLACTLSVWTITIHPASPSGTVKWSIPANSIFSVAVANLFVAVAGFQALFEPGGVQAYYRSEVTALIQFSFLLGAFYTAMQAVVLLRVRTFLTVSQLRLICLYKLVVNIVLAFVWMPELSPDPVNNKVMGYFLLVFVITSYFNGFLWAGRAEGISRILSGEKKD